jgi:hypothetical protein
MKTRTRSIKKQKPSIASARRKLLSNLANYGIEWDKKEQRLQVEDLRETQRKLSEITNLSGLQYKEEVADYFAKPSHIDISKVEPYLVLLPEKQSIYHKIWAYAVTHWSVPVSAGYGRRIRYLVFDKQNDKLIGLFGLCDPLIGSNIRDNFIGWNRTQKHERLYNCMTAYVLGAVPPYNLALGSKLIALTTMSPQVRRDFHKKYQDNKTIIAGKERLPYLAFIDTYGAFQKSAIYTRLFNWDFVGYTQGQSHIHITANGSWEVIRQFVPGQRFERYKYGHGSNWKLRTLKIGLSELGFNENILGIGWRRAYYVCPLTTNWRKFLTTEHKRPKFIKESADDLVEYWHERWVNPRIMRLQEALSWTDATFW